MRKTFVLATRASPLALKQTDIAKEYLEKQFPDCSFRVLEVASTGDKQQNWSLEKQGGSGLFTKELEEALLVGKAQIAVHSAKDLPTILPGKLTIAGYVEREDASDTFLIKKNVTTPKIIATSSPRRRAQLQIMYPKAQFVEIRGRISTRIEKIVQGLADATVMATAGLKRLNISNHPDLVFKKLPFEEMVPAVGQGAIALETNEALAATLKPHLCSRTYLAVTLERQLLKSLGGGCNASYAGHFHQGNFYIFHKTIGFKKFLLNDIDNIDIPNEIKKIINFIHEADKE